MVSCRAISSRILPAVAENLKTVTCVLGFKGQGVNRSWLYTVLYFTSR